MKPINLLTGAFIIAFHFTCLASATAAAQQTPDLDALFGELQQYDWGRTNTAPATINELSGRAHANDGLRAGLEQRLIALLQTDAPFAAKQFACKKLAAIGSEQAVPALASILQDAQLSHGARTALESIGGTPARKALMNALTEASGSIKAGIVASLGALRVTESHDALLALAKADDRQIAHAAVAALGQIGTAGTVTALQPVRATAASEMKAALATAALEIAFRLSREDKKDEAAAIFKDLYAGNEPESVRVAAFSGLLRAEPVRAPSRMVEVFKDNDDRLIQAAVNYLLELRGSPLPGTVTSSVEQFSAPGKLALLNTCAARRDTSARPMVLQLVEDSSVGLEAIEALGECGTADDIRLLTDILEKGEPDAKAMAVQSLERLRDPKANQGIVSALAEASPQARAELINALAGRYATETLEAIVRYQNAPETRPAVVKALGALGSEQQMIPLLNMYQGESADPRFRAAVENALWSLCERRKERCLPTILEKLKTADTETHTILLGLLPSVGNTEALDAVRTAVASRNEDVHDAAVRQLADWPETEAIPDLKRVFQMAENRSHRDLALRGMVRLITDASDMQEPERLALLKEAMERASGVNDKRMILSGLSSLSSVEALEYVTGLLDDDSVKPEVQSATYQIARRARGENETATRQIVSRVIGKISDPTLVERLKLL